MTTASLEDFSPDVTVSWLNTSWTNVTSDPRPELPQFVLYTFLVFRVLWSILALGGNALTIIAICKFHILQKRSNYFICSLAIADALFAVAAPVEIIHSLYPNDGIYITSCLVDKIINFLYLRGNYLNILLISLDRLLSIACPFRYPIFMTTKVSLTILCSVWVYMLVETPVLMAFYSTITMGVQCKFFIIINPVVYQNYLLPQFFLSFILTILFYCIIAKIAHGHQKKINAQNLPYQTLEQSLIKKQNKIAKMMLNVVATYSVSYSVQLILANIIRFSTSSLSLSMERGTLVFFYMTTWLNPFIYAWRDKDFRYCFKKLLFRNNVVGIGHSEQ